MKINRRELWLFATPLLVLLLAFGVKMWPKHCPNRIMVSVGGHSSRTEGDRAAVQELSRQIRLCPQTPIYEIKYKLVRQNGTKTKLMGHVSISFLQQHQELFYSARSAFTTELRRTWSKVDSQIIHKVAQTADLEQDLSEHGCPRLR